MKQELGFVRPEGGGKTLAELINLPSLNINGISSANVGKMTANVIPTSPLLLWTYVWFWK
jgi:hypothetical protein